MKRRLLISLSTMFLIILSMTPLLMLSSDSSLVLEGSGSSSLSEGKILVPGSRSPKVREPSIIVDGVMINRYRTDRSRDIISAPITKPLLATFVDLDVAKGIEEAIFTINIASGEHFLAIDGSSLSSIEVKITIYYPNSTSEEYVTRSDAPLHRIIINPSPGTYRIRLSIERAWTRAWIQAVTLNNGTASLESIEKQYRYMVPGEARYIRLNLTYENWAFLYTHIVRGGYVAVSLWKVPEMIFLWERLVDEWVGWKLYEFMWNLEGEYMLVIRSIEHVDVSYTLAIPDKAAYPLNLDEGKTLYYSIPYDVEIYEFDVTNEEWIALDWSVEPSGSGTIYSEIILVSPGPEIIYWDSANAYELKYTVLSDIRQGKYILIIISTYMSSTVFKITTLDGVLDITSRPTISLNISFTQCGQSIYYRTRSSNTLALLVTLNGTFFIANVLDLDGKELETRIPYYFATSLGEETLLRNSDVDYIIRVQAQRGHIYLHLRPLEQKDYLVTTPDDSDLKFRFAGDVIVLGVSLEDADYFAQFYASMNLFSRTMILLIDSNNIIRRVVLLQYECWYWWENCGLEQFHVYRHRHEIEEPMNGVWRLVATSDRAGINARVSQIQEGDEEYYADTPNHRYHTFNFDYELRSFKINIPASKWMSIVAFNQRFNENAWLYVFNEELYSIINCKLHDTSVTYAFFEDVKEDVFTFFLAGVSGANVSISVISHNDLLAIGGQSPAVKVTTTKTTTLPITTAATYTTAYTVTSTVTTVATEGQSPAVKVTTTKTTTLPITTTVITATTRETIPNDSFIMILIALTAMLLIGITVSFIRIFKK